MLWSYMDLGSNPSSPLTSSVTLGKLLNRLGSRFSQPWEGVSNTHLLPGPGEEYVGKSGGASMHVAWDPAPTRGSCHSFASSTGVGPGLKATW